ncbi:MAG: C39 family peptidase [Patescibacteria group bacterium]|nr:C39 family peptidase [Patescibacteria group bacterium]
MKKRTSTIILLLLFASLIWFGRHQILDVLDSWTAEPIPEVTPKDEVIKNENTNENLNTNQAPEPVVLPDEFNLNVPFTTQSPYAEWTEQDNESCEEAALLITHYYWQDKAFTKEIAKQELQKIVDFEMDYFGYYKDTTAEETAELAQQMWGYDKVEVISDFTMEDIKKHVYQGRPVILPTAGRMLDNPNFRSPGPLYHMLVVRGWNKDNIITNDPGTRKGENFQYTPENLYKAIHDWNDGDPVNGQKVIIVIYGENST